MPFSPVGFALGYSLAQRSNVPQNAPTVGLVGGVAGTTPLGVALSVVLAQRLAVQAPRPQQQVIAPPPPPVIPAPVAGPGAVGAIAGLLNPNLAAPGGVAANGQELANRLVVRVQWDAVPNAQSYSVCRHFRAGQDQPWGEPVEVYIIHEPPRQADFILPENMVPQQAQQQVGFTVRAVSPQGLGAPSAPLTPNFP